MPLQLLEIGFHVEIHAIEWHDFQRETQFHGVVVAWIEFSQKKIRGVTKLLESLITTFVSLN